MESEGFDVEEWDGDFLDQLVQAEELALSTQVSHHRHPRVPPEPMRPLVCDVSYSPPRELSQRVVETSVAGSATDCFDYFAPRESYSGEQHEIDRLKKELNRVSKHLHDLEQECSELKRARDGKEEQLKGIPSRVEAKDTECHHTGSAVTDYQVAPGSLAACEHANISKNQGQNVGHNTVEVHTNKTEEGTSAVQKGGFVSEKLINLWNSRDQQLGRVLVTQLFITCKADFQVLFGYLNCPRNGTDMALTNKLCTAESIEATKVSHLYSVLTMISNDALRLEDLLEALVDLCNLKNMVIIHRSLRVLQTILSNSFCMEKEFGRRENVLVEGPFSGNTKADLIGCGNLEDKSLYLRNPAEIFKEGQSPCGLNLSNVKNSGHVVLSDHRFATCISSAYWVSLFERMCQIAVNNKNEQIWHEALLIMNLILMRRHAYSERNKFAGELVFRSLSQLLRRESGFSVQNQAIHTLHLLCNCPKVIAMLCCGCKEDRDLSSSEDMDEKNCSTFQELNDILAGLADCVASYGSSTAEEMTLRRNAIVFLAFLGSSGKSGFEVLLTFQLSKGTHFLRLILQSLISDLDLQASKPTRRSVFVRKQWLLIREALIFLNRLVSHPQYSLPVLQALTSTREMVSMTVDIAHRLTQKTKLSWQDDITTKQLRESEIVDLAWVFKKRVFAFLGDAIS